jgi:hypothetical protein
VLYIGVVAIEPQYCHQFQSLLFVTFLTLFIPPFLLEETHLFYLFSFWQPLHEELYNMHPSVFFLPTFLEAVRSNTEECFRSIMTEPIPGVYSFAMLQPTFCEMLLEEVWYIKDKK